MAVLDISALFPFSLTDWPGKKSALVLVPGCNFRCGYCFARALVLTPEQVPRLDTAQVLDKLRHREKEIEAVIVSGGEPLLYGQALASFLESCHSFNLLTRIETNGSNPFWLQWLLERDLVDSVVLDIKAPLDAAKYTQATHKRAVVSAIRKSIALLGQAGVDYEIRVVVVPTKWSVRDVIALSKAVGPAKRLVLCQFWPQSELVDKSFEQLPKTDHDELLSLAQTIDALGLGIREIRIRTDKGEETVRVLNPKSLPAMPV